MFKILFIYGWSTDSVLIDEYDGELRFHICFKLVGSNLELEHIILKID